MAIRVGVSILQFCSVSNSFSHTNLTTNLTMRGIFFSKNCVARLYSMRQYVYICIFIMCWVYSNIDYNILCTYCPKLLLFLQSENLELTRHFHVVWRTYFWRPIGNIRELKHTKLSCQIINLTQFDHGHKCLFRTIFFITFIQYNFSQFSKQNDKWINRKNIAWMW